MAKVLHRHRYTRELSRTPRRVRHAGVTLSGFVSDYDVALFTTGVRDIVTA